LFLEPQQQRATQSQRIPKGMCLIWKRMRLLWNCMNFDVAADERAFKIMLLMMNLVEFPLP